MFARSACGDTRARGQRCANDLGMIIFCGVGLGEWVIDLDGVGARDCED